MPDAADARDAAAEFRVPAEQFCALIDVAGKRDRERLLRDLAACLSALYGAALRLPNVAPETDELLNERLTREQWGATFDRLLAALGEYDAYRTAVPFPEEKAEELKAHLADDLADIYRDLKNGLLWLASGEDVREVVWEWRFGFWTHWGRHLTEALRVIHARLAETGGPVVVD